MEERRRSNRRKSGLGGKGTLFAILGVVVIGTAGSIYSNQNEKPVDVKQEVKAQDEKSTTSTKQFKTSVKVQSPSDITDPEKIQAALDAGPGSLKDTIDATDQFIDRLMTKQEAVRKTKKLPIKDFQQTITKDVVQQIDDQITSLNEASQTAHTMAMGLLLNQEKGATFENTEGLDYQNLEQLSQNLNAMASSFETYAMAKNFESWGEASSYLPNRRDKSLLAVPLNDAITKTVESNSEPIIAEPVTEEGNADAQAEVVYDTDTILPSIYNVSQMYDQLAFKIDELNKMVGTSGDKVTAPISSQLFSLKEMINPISGELTTLQNANTPDDVATMTQQLAANQDEINRIYERLQLQFQSIDQQDYSDAAQLSREIKQNFNAMKRLAQPDISAYTTFMMKYADEEAS
ncbi:hypothetical protein RSA11_04570 [Exiguobacterium indicum]|uniref:Uncharacterized protein n=1 Tax=Exiguobacterium indicum TaxID=296995 RepID=A0AAW3MGT5_9BACL|nr:hypothetical protein [Exiguobacterium indicum]KTR27936.1 hypothetical protein RSA11_04570 [Exiguobacterium indicum]